MIQNSLHVGLGDKAGESAKNSIYHGGERLDTLGSGHKFGSHALPFPRL